VTAIVDNLMRDQILWIMSVVVFLLLFALTAFILRQLIGVFSGLVDIRPA
jgi:hypothetical protein